MRKNNSHYISYINPCEWEQDNCFLCADLLYASASDNNRAQTVISNAQSQTNEHLQSAARLREGDENVVKTISSDRGVNNKFKQTVYNILPYTIICLFVFAIFALFLAQNSIYPFGDKIISSYDMLAQVAPFIEHFFDVIDGKASLFYTTAIAGGADVFGTLAYCCISPFTFVFLLFGKGNVYYATAIVLPLKIACIGVSALFYIRKRFPHINMTGQLALALSYAFCGYLYVANTYISWVDLLIYLPLLALGFNRLIFRGKRALFIVAMCCLIYTCFSISCFSLFLVYPIIILYCVFVLPKQRRKNAIVDVVFSLVASIMFSLPILLPSFVSFMASARKTGIFSNLFNDISADALYQKTSYIATDALVVVFTLLYFAKYGVNRPIDRFLLTAGLITLLPVLCDECCLLLNFGSYYSYSFRFGFLNGFYFLFVASMYADDLFKHECFVRADNSLCSTNIEQTSDCENNCVSTAKNADHSNEKVIIKSADQTKKTTESSSESLMIKVKAFIKSNKKILWCVLLFVVCITALVGMVIFYNAIENGLFKYFSPSGFAHSYGGLQVSACVFAIVAIMVLLAGLLIKFKKIKINFAALILLLIVAGQSTFYGSYLVTGNIRETTDYDRIGVLTDYIKELDGNDYARVKYKRDFVTADATFTLHTNAVSVFSSVIDARNFKVTSFFDYGGNGINTMKSYNGTFFGDCLLGYDYYITEDEYSPTDYQAVEEVTKLIDDDGNIKDVGDYRLYKSLYSFPHAFAVPNDASDYSNGTLLEYYDSLLKMLGGEEYSLTEVNISNVNEDPSNPGVFKISYSYASSSYFFIVFDFENYQDISYVKGSYKADQEKKIDDSRSVKMSTSTTINIKSTGAALNREYILEHTKVYRLENSVVKNLSALAKSKQGNIQINNGNISVDVTAKAGEYLFLNYIALPGHTAYVNGVKCEMQENCLGFMLVPLDDGENHVVIRYSSPYVKLALIGVICALLFAAVYFVCLKKISFIQNKFGTAIQIAAYALVIAVALFFFVMPICVFFYKSVCAVIKIFK